MSLFLLILYCYFQKHVLPKNYYYLDGPKDRTRHSFSLVKKNKIGFDISEIVFVNWNAGGTSSISGLLKGKFNRIYTKNNYNWTNELIVRYI
jgi:hypothetical protein